ncbi:glycosyltransferase [Pontibacter sp. BT731]|uniref:glycosyltransferase n=1 Tax=Pontibacter coccineus TaxID=3063328 RepID=UPI0026E19478|nr:glycosyltransferase [Pontibacter sp. BT731]MDO6390238.1 glycosyltransferase [Pontibacter sp. BT731]
MVKVKSSGALFIMPRSSEAWYGAEALWITVAGWAAAAEMKYGKAWIATTDRVASPQEVLHYPIVKGERKVDLTKTKWYSGIIPTVFKTGIKDWLLYRRQPVKWPLENDGDWNKPGSDIKFVWEQHDLFPGPGQRIAESLNVPFIIYVHAPVVWELEKWGVKRPIWGKYLEQHVEASSLKKADLVACVSEEVRSKVIEMGVSPAKVYVSPMAADSLLFLPKTKDKELVSRYKLDGKLVVGWTGSFRSFHGLDIVVKAFSQLQRKIEHACLLLVGEGSEKAKIEALVNELSLQDSVVFAGKQAFADIPDYVSVFDVALVSAKSAEGFHYSPLKLREYLAAGKATIAPNAGEIPIKYQDNENVLLYEAGSVDDLYNKMYRLISDEDFRLKLKSGAISKSQESGTWVHELDRTISKIEVLSKN